MKKEKNHIANSLLFFLSASSVLPAGGSKEGHGEENNLSLRNQGQP